MDINKIREIAKLFVDIPIYDRGMFHIASHPFTNAWVSSIYDENEKKNILLDLSKEEDLNKWRTSLKEHIDKADLYHICIMLHKPYILTFISYIEHLLSDDELGEVLATFWTYIEDITGDKNVNGKQIIKWYKRANKNKLMNKENLEFYESLPEKVTIYRGVTFKNKAKKKALSWTLDYDVALWFANRYQTGTGEVWKMEVPKERILCYFGEFESEVIVNLYSFSSDMEIITL